MQDKTALTLRSRFSVYWKLQLLSLRHTAIKRINSRADASAITQFLKYAMSPLKAPNGERRAESIGRPRHIRPDCLPCPCMMHEAVH
jgi:hypothetical protein